MGRAVATARWKGNTAAADQHRGVLVLPGAGYRSGDAPAASLALLVAASGDQAWDGDPTASTGKSVHLGLWRGPAL